MGEVFVRQFRRPEGPLGRLAGWIMAARPSNRSRSRATVALLDIGAGDRVLELGGLERLPELGVAFDRVLSVNGRGDHNPRGGGRLRGRPYGRGPTATRARDLRAGSEAKRHRQRRAAMSEREQIAKQYFEAFHAGQLDEVFGYFADDGVVRYGRDAAKPAREFFPETKSMIAQVRFTTHGVYTSPATHTVLIHFSFTMPSEDGKGAPVEAVDVIEFDRQNKITRITVIPNG
jgi:ketosteroid isomerase-like protein